jgi:hypothetical protein
MDLGEMGCDYVRWIELAQDRVQWRALVSAVLNLRVLLPENLLISNMDLMEMGGGLNWLRIVSSGGLWY